MDKITTIDLSTKPNRQDVWKEEIRESIKSMQDTTKEGEGMKGMGKEGRGDNSHGVGDGSERRGRKGRTRVPLGVGEEGWRRSGGGKRGGK